ncbi:hypothetical protein GCM10011428_53460 [Streptomyces violaceus]
MPQPDCCDFSTIPLSWVTVVIALGGANFFRSVMGWCSLDVQGFGPARPSAGSWSQVQVLTEKRPQAERTDAAGADVLAPRAVWKGKDGVAAGQRLTSTGPRGGERGRDIGPHCLRSPPPRARWKHGM